MLLPSAIPCDQSPQPQNHRQQPQRPSLLSRVHTPPASPRQLSTQHPLGNIFTTCRSLQSLLANHAPGMVSPSSDAPITPPSTSHGPEQQQPQLALTPPLAPAPPPLKLRLRSRRAIYEQQQQQSNDNNANSGADHLPVMARKKIVKRAPPPPRCANKRRRAVDEEEDTDSDQELYDLDPFSDFHADENVSRQDSHQTNPSTLAPPITLQPSTSPTRRAITNANPLDQHPSSVPSQPHTPKRARIAPTALPLGLERSDFHSLHHEEDPSNEDRTRDAEIPGTDLEIEADGETWSTEEDRILVELVLEKLRLTKLEWKDCARSLGKDPASVGRRWRSLILHGDVGIKPSRSSRRRKIHATWR